MTTLFRLKDLVTHPYDRPFDAPDSLCLGIEQMFVQVTHSWCREALQDNLAALRTNGLISDGMVCDFVDSTRFNAFAWRTADLDTVLFNSGVSLCLGAVYSWFLSSRNSFPTIGSPGRERSSLDPWPALPDSFVDNVVAKVMELGASSILELLDDLPAQIQADVKRHLSRQATYSVDITKVSPLDPKRQQMAFLLLRWSMLFMLLHEVGHIVHGHVDYARRELHAVEYREAGGSPDVVLRRAQEQQADIFATTLMHFAVLRHPRELHPDLFGGKTEECIRALAFALVTVFSTIAVAEGSIPHEQRTHPDPRERFVAAITIGLEESRLEGIIASSDILQIGFEALFDVESLFREAFTKSTNPWRLDDDGIGVPLGLASTAETREQWRHWAKYDRYEAARRRKAGISWQIRL